MAVDAALGKIMEVGQGSGPIYDESPLGWRTHEPRSNNVMSPKQPIEPSSQRSNNNYKKNDLDDDPLAIAAGECLRDVNNGANKPKRHKEKIISVPTTLDPKKHTVVALAPSEWGSKKRA